MKRLSVTLRRITIEDIDTVAEIEQETFPSPWSAQSIRDVLTKNILGRGIIAEYGDHIAGYAFYWIIMDELHIANIAVRTEYRRRKIGAGMLKYMLDEGLKQGAVYALLEVRASNYPAIKMYEHFGFTHMHTRRNYYSDTQEDALVMSKILSE
ncbi:ribosomal protein S18-alanine N-acetyltransferase [candidate division KSB1 bacterium]